MDPLENTRALHGSITGALARYRRPQGALTLREQIVSAGVRTMQRVTASESEHEVGHGMENRDIVYEPRAAVGIILDRSQDRVTQSTCVTEELARSSAR